MLDTGLFSQSKCPIFQTVEIFIAEQNPVDIFLTSRADPRL